MKPADVAVTHHFVQLPSLRMHYVEAGTGPLVVLLHGFPENWWSWRYQLQPLVAAGFRVIAPDLRGYGETDKQGPYDLDTIVGDVCNLIESLGVEKRARIVGHDWGGAVAWHLASKRPEFCERLTVMNCPHPAVMQKVLLGKRLSWAQLKKSWYFFFFMLPFVPEWALTKDDARITRKTISSASFDRAHFSEEELRPFGDGIQRPGAASAMVGWYREAVRDGFRHAFSPKKYADIAVETLLVWGMKDPALGFEDLVPGTEAFVPKLTVERIPDCGHFVHAERPELVNPALISFLSR
ncbi:MAG: alpha/beta hydrolase [Archangium sp.]|nr:alpha/beta hydrolase [Archangium sp.]